MANWFSRLFKKDSQKESQDNQNKSQNLAQDKTELNEQELDQQILENSETQTQEYSSQDDEEISEQELNELEEIQELQILKQQTLKAEQNNTSEQQETLENEDQLSLDTRPVLSEQPETKKTGLFSRLMQGLTKTSHTLGAGLTYLFKGKKIDKEIFYQLEEQLLIADVGIETTDKLIKNLTDHVKITQLDNAEVLFNQLKKELHNLIAPCEQPFVVDTSKKPYVILMIGVNGVGKTTTIGKLTKKLQAQGKSVMLAAGDTFRAAAIEQLQEWGTRNNVPVIAQQPGSDAAAVIYSAIESAKAKGVDVLIADTAGRLQNKSHLLEELKKIIKVIKRLDDTAPHEVMITLDASTGQNALSQIQEFDKAITITGINLTKLDGTAKGGIIFAICDKFNKPIRFIGVGEKIDDLQVFNADSFIQALFEQKQ